MGSLNIFPTVIDWFRNKLFGRRQRIRIENTFSDCGVLSPLLFAVFKNSISNHLAFSHHFHADDLQFYAQAPVEQLGEAISTIKRDMEQICVWNNQHG